MTKRTLHRIWCKKCNEFELHDTNDFKSKELFCSTCGTEYSDVYLRDIPEEKLLEQRKRYTKSLSAGFVDLYSSFISGYGISDLMGSFESVDGSISIKESDAGQKEIDNLKKERLRILRNEAVIKRQADKELKNKYHKLGRNQICLCGSNNKYKKCCYDKIQKL